MGIQQPTVGSSFGDTHLQQRAWTREQVKMESKLDRAVSPRETSDSVMPLEKPPLSPTRTELASRYGESVEVFIPSSPTSMMDLRLLYVMDTPELELKAADGNDIPAAISFTAAEAASGTVCGGIDDEEDDELLGLGFLGDDDVEVVDEMDTDL